MVDEKIIYEHEVKNIQCFELFHSVAYKVDENFGEMPTLK